MAPAAGGTFVLVEAGWPVGMAASLCKICLSAVGFSLAVAVACRGPGGGPRGVSRPPSPVSCSNQVAATPSRSHEDSIAACALRLGVRSGR